MDSILYYNDTGLIHSTIDKVWFDNNIYVHEFNMNGYEILPIIISYLRYLTLLCLRFICANNLLKQISQPLPHHITKVYISENLQNISKYWQCVNHCRHCSFSAVKSEF